MMFIIGIEMDIKKLWAMRRAIFGYGGLQVALCAVLLATIFTLFGAPWRVGVAAGFALSLSSTAMVIAILEQNRQMDTPLGQTCFGILLFQDIAAIPMIALLPLLSPAPMEDNEPSGWLMAVKAIAMLAAVVVCGRFVLQRALRMIQRSATREIFTIFALLWVIGIALLMHVVHLSMSLGAFVAGMLLAGSESRHEIEADMAPFKGILLGLFHCSGNVDRLQRSGGQTMAGRHSGNRAGRRQAAGTDVPGQQDQLAARTALLFAILLSQGGEFAFVVTAAAQAARLLDNDQSSIVTVVVALSMATTPLLLLAHRKLMVVRTA